MPISGAPRTARRRMAPATSSAPRSSSSRSANGSAVWSSTRSRAPSQCSARAGIARRVVLRPLRVRTVALAVFLALALAPAAQAAEPIMPLDQVRAGMRCTGLTVVRGVDIATFDVDVIDVVAGQPSEDPRILVRVSGPAVDATGVAEGYSGSPVYCTGDDGVRRNAGGISETVGQYGETVALVTPIEQMLGVPSDPPVNPRSDPALLRRAKPLRGVL